MFSTIPKPRLASVPAAVVAIGISAAILTLSAAHAAGLVYLGIKVRDRLRTVERNHRTLLRNDVKRAAKLDALDRQLRDIRGHVDVGFKAVQHHELLLKKWGQRTDRGLERVQKTNGRLVNASKRIERGLVHQNDLLSEGVAELVAQHGLSALRFEHPIFFGAWSIDAFTAKEIITALQYERPRVILELGSGTSTVVIAKMIELLGLETRHIVVDHLEEFLDKTREAVRLQGLQRQPEFWLCPLDTPEGDEPPWYGGLLERLEGEKIDFVLVDGPPGTLHPRARRPALPKLWPYLSDTATLLVDDAGRKDEREMLDAWGVEFEGLSTSLRRAGKGVAIVRVNKVRGISTAGEG